MANPTPAQLAQFAEMIGITPDTHRHLFSHRPHCPLDTPAGDDVFLAPLLRWCMSQRMNYKVGPSLADSPQESWAASGYPYDEVYAPTATLALIRACQSARVPEIVAIFGKGE